MAMIDGALFSWWPKAWNPLWWWRDTSSSDYETVLAALASEIEQVQTTLFDIKTRKRRAIHTVLGYMTAAWLALLAVIWATAALRSVSGGTVTARTNTPMLALVLGTPLLIVLLHRVVSMWYGRLERAQEQHLRTLRAQKRAKVNEIKKATDFDHLRRLLERYDDDPKSRREQPRRTDDGAPGQQPQLRGKASMPTLGARVPPQQGRSSVQQQHARVPSAPGQVNMGLAPRASHAPEQAIDADSPSGRELLGGLAPPITMTHLTGRRTWLDKVADMILGTDPYGTTAEEQQYALICRNCFRHNGLVPKQELGEIQYVCPHCDTFNSRRPSSRPVSSPFSHRDETPAHAVERPRGTERLQGAAPHHDAQASQARSASRTNEQVQQLGRVAQSREDAPTESEVRASAVASNEGGVRRSARLQAASSMNDDTMQVDE